VEYLGLHAAHTALELVHDHHAAAQRRLCLELKVALIGVRVIGCGLRLPMTGRGIRIIGRGFSA
jgi:hypothetical protein